MANKLKNLIQELCPDGVKFVKLGEVCEILDAQRKPISKGKRVAGKYPYYGANGIQDYVEGYLFDGTYLLVGEDGSVINEDYTPVLNWATGKIWVNNHAHILSEKKEIALLRFVYYTLQGTNVSAIVRGLPPKLNQENLRNIEIPLPPLAIQSRIVEILDNFSSLTAELQAELQARRSQYEYYRNHLLSFDGYDNIQNENNTNTNNSAAAQGKTVKWVKLGEVCNDKLERISSQLLNSGNYTSVENLIKNRSGRIDAENVPSEGSFIKYNKEDILIGNIRPYLKKIWFADKVGGTNGDVIVIQVCDNYSDTIDKRYLFQVLSSDKFFDYDNNFAKGGKMPRGDKSAIKNFPIPLPSLSEQRRIADILDRFEALTTDLQSGLPAEIEARQKQYEYYRNKLLTFND